MWLQKLSIREHQMEGGEHSYTGVSTTASIEVTTTSESKKDIVLSACSYKKITEEKNSHWLPQTCTPHHSVHSYIPLGIILLCCIFIYLSLDLTSWGGFLSLCPVNVFVILPFSFHPAFRAAKKESQQSLVSSCSIHILNKVLVYVLAETGTTQNSLHTDWMYLTVAD